MSNGDFEKDPGFQYLGLSREQRAESASRPFDSKKNVWVPDAEDGFVAAEIQSVQGDQVTVVTAKGNSVTVKKDEAQEMNPPKFDKTEDMANLTFLNEASVLANLKDRYKDMMIYVTVKKDEAQEMNPPKFDKTEDMANLTFLNEASVLANLKDRYKDMMIYTYSGLFCVVINPYKRLPIYTESVIKFYMGKRRNEMPPHLFATSDEAYRNMVQGFVAAEIQSVQGDQVTVVTAKGNSVTVKKDEAQEMNPPKFDKTEDMANLTFLNEASVLANLKDRQIQGHDDLQSVIKFYMGKRRNEMPPHLFATSDEAYRNMVQDRENQSMLITGESGAGKTENTKKVRFGPLKAMLQATNPHISYSMLQVIAYFAIVGATQQAAEKRGEGVKGVSEPKKASGKGGTLEEQIVQTNPVLEAFGNAKTVRNNNSSRFGKFIRTHFSAQGKLAGGDIEHYLLEKSRVVRQAPGERSYHIFYQLMSGHNPKIRDQLKLTHDLKYYHFCSQAELTIDGVDDKEEMALTQEAFDVMGFEDDEVLDLYKSCAAIMHMGEMKFKQRPREEQAEPDGDEDAQNVAHCLGVSSEELLKSLTKPRVRVGTEWVNKGQNLEQVHWAVAGLGKAIYARMFKWLIGRCNKTLDAKQIERRYFIGVLDIAGFEIFDFNSFEQLWINFVNERLQQFFNHHMFVLEQEEYKREGIQWTFIDFGLDLQACIELIEKPLGLISMLDEECIVPKATDMTYVQKLNDQHLGKHPNFQKPRPPKGKQAEAHFAVVHYAGTVRYNATNFLEKNKDPLNDTAVALLKAHSTDCKLMLEIWADYQTQEEAAEAAKSGTGGGKKKASPLGLISMLDEECIVPKATDMTYVQKLNDQHLGKHPNFQKPRPPKGKQAEAHFAVVHYAGTVRYNATNFLEKNKDPLNDTAVALLKAHSTDCKLMLEIWADYQTQEEAAEAAKSGTGGGKKKASGKSASFMTVSMIYRESLNNLMNMLYQTHPHFIRCIIPNEKKTSGLIDSALVLNQLTCNGVLEGIRICRKGFPNRMLYDDFRHRYAVLAADVAKNEDTKAASIAITDKLVTDGLLKDEEFKIGNTKARSYHTGIPGRCNSSGVFPGVLQSRWYLGLTELRRRQQQQAGLLIVQRNVRSWCTLRTWEWFKLYGKVKPMLKAGKEAEEMEKLSGKIKELEEAIAKGDESRKQLESQVAGLIEEKNALFLNLEKEKANLQDAEERNQKLAALKADLDKQLAEVQDRLADMEDRNSDLTRLKKKMEQEIAEHKKHAQDLELSLKKSRKREADHNIRSLQDEMANQDEAVARLNKEKKHQEEVNRKLMEDLQAEEDRVNHMEKVRAKLEQQLDDLEDSMDREKRARQDLEKRAQGCQENIDEITKQKHDVEQNLKKKEAELHQLSTRLEEEQSLVAKLQRQIKELQARIAELEEELENERQSRAKADRSRSELQRELEEISERLEEQGGATAAQLEANKKREAELAKLRRDQEESNLNHETALASLRKKHHDAVAELTDQLEQLQKLKVKADKEKAQLQRELEEVSASVDSEVRTRQDIEKQLKVVEVQYAEAQTKADEQSRQLNDFAALKNRLHNENGDLGRQLEDMENQLNSLHRLKAQLTSQLEETKRSYDEEARERQALAAQVKNFEHENDSLRDQLDSESEAKAELLRQISKQNAEIQQWKARFESEGLAKLDEIEEAKRKLQGKVQELTDANEMAFAKIGSLEKTRHKLMQDLDDAQVDVERAAAYAAALEKKQKGFDKIIDEWRKKHDDLAAELDAAQRDNRNLSTDLFRAKTAQDELAEHLESVRRENKQLAQEIIDEWRKKHDDLAAELDAAQRDNRNLSTDLFRAKTAQDELAEHLESVRRENKQLAQEVKDLADQLGEGGRSVHELQKMVRRLEVEKEELQKALDEAEAALEAEEAKVLRAQVEVSQIRSEIEKRIQEKEEEFENTRKNHQRALESMQATLEAETKHKEEALRIKKKLEADINELEIALDHANRANADAQKTIKKYMETVRELQLQVEDEQRQKDEIREQFLNSEKRNAILQAEKEELSQMAEAAERARRNAEGDCIELREQNNDLSSQLNGITAVKRKLEGELQAMHAELDETLAELKNVDEMGKKAAADAARLAEELRQEQEHSMHIERIRKGLEVQIKEMQIRLDEAEAAALKGGKKIIAQLEQRIRSLEQELDGEQRRHQDTDKNWRKSERRVKEVEFQLEEDKKNQERLTELIDKLQAKLKVFKRQVEEAEEVAATNLGKYRQLQAQLDDAEERADIAENALSKMRNKIRASASVGPSQGGLMQSASSAVMRSTSFARGGEY
ncbi:myosin head [Ostertagia ostertagi]